MSEEEQKLLVGRKRSRHAANEELTPLQKMNRKLNVAIAIVSALVIFVTVTILNNRPEVAPSKATQQEPQAQQADEQPVQAEPNSEQDAPVTSSEQVTADEHTVSESADANVIEVWTNEAWTPFPTKQTGTHTSVFEEGHIDYEEKLAAAFSVLPIERESSIVTSARNNGDAKSARIVVTSKDRSQNFRVIIQWVEGEGWLPTTVDVLYNVDGVR